MEQETKSRKTQTSAKVKLMDFLARRDHSERELIKKLLRHFSVEEIEEAILWARQHGWLAPADKISKKVADTLHRKHKGIFFINSYLREKGLPSVPKDSQVELEKARHLVKNKTRLLKPGTDGKQKLSRFLASRGFDGETIRKALHEKF